MKHFFKIGMLLFIFGILFATYTYTQHHFRGRGGNRRENKCGNSNRHGMMKMYDIDSEKTFTEKIIRIEKIHNKMGIQFHVFANNDTIPVRIAPVWFLDEQNVSFKENETVEITGSKMTDDDETFFVAGLITTSDDKITLRDDEGFPLWHGYEKRHRR